VWGYWTPDEASAGNLIEQIKLDEHTLNSALDPDELSRLEFEPEHTAIIFKRPNATTAETISFPGALGPASFSQRTAPHHRAPRTRPRSSEASRSSAFNPFQDVPAQAHLPGDLPFVEHLRGINMISTELEQQVNICMENNIC